MLWSQGGQPNPRIRGGVASSNEAGILSLYTFLLLSKALEKEELRKMYIDLHLNVECSPALITVLPLQLRTITILQTLSYTNRSKAIAFCHAALVPRSTIHATNV